MSKSPKNKRERASIKQRKYKARLSLYKLVPGENTNFHGFKNASVPCSCYLCRDEKYRTSRMKTKLHVLKIIQDG